MIHTKRKDTNARRDTIYFSLNNLRSSFEEIKHLPPSIYLLPHEISELCQVMSSIRFEAMLFSLFYSPKKQTSLFTLLLTYSAGLVVICRILSFSRYCLNVSEYYIAFHRTTFIIVIELYSFFVLKIAYTATI